MLEPDVLVALQCFLCSETGAQDHRESKSNKTPVVVNISIQTEYKHHLTPKIQTQPFTLTAFPSQPSKNPTPYNPD
jgi:hypothetical protein